MGHRLCLSALLTIATAGIAAAQTVAPAPPVPVPSSAQTAGPRGASPDAQSVIRGTVVDAESHPIPNVTVRLRNMQTRKVDFTTAADQKGEFTFAVQPGIPYAVEVVNPARQVVATGRVIVTQSGDVAGEQIALAAALPEMSRMFADTVGSVISAVAGVGLTTLQSTLPGPPPLSPER